MATARKPATPAEPEGTPIEGEVVEETPKPPGALEYLRTAASQMKAQLRAELKGEVAEVKRALDDLGAVVTDLGSGQAEVQEEDALSDRLDQLIDHKLGEMFGLNATADSQKTLAAQLASLTGVFTEVQTETNQRLARIEGVAERADKQSLSLAGVNERLEQLNGNLAEHQIATGKALLEVQEVIKGTQARVDQTFTESWEGGPVAPAQGPVNPGAPAILGALWRVMEDVTYVPKGGTYQGGSSGNYKFRRFDDVAKELGEAFRRHGIFLKPSVVGRHTERFEIAKEYSNGGKSVQNWTDTRVEVQYSFVSLVDGSEQVVSVLGEGRDLSDKSTAKAMTMALKTVLTQAFMLPTDAPDPDSERPGDEPEPQDRTADEADEARRREEYYARQDGEPAAAPSADKPVDPPEVRAANALKLALKPGTTKSAWGSIIRKATEHDLMMIQFEDGETLQAKLMALRGTLAEG